MIEIILLVFTLILPDGSGHLVIQQEPTMEQCQKDGTGLAANAQALLDDKEISTYTGACIVKEINPQLGST